MQITSHWQFMLHRDEGKRVTIHSYQKCLQALKKSGKRLGVAGSRNIKKANEVKRQQNSDLHLSKTSYTTIEKSRKHINRSQHLE